MQVITAQSYLKHKLTFRNGHAYFFSSCSYIANRSCVFYSENLLSELKGQNSNYYYYIDTYILTSEKPDMTNSISLDIRWLTSRCEELNQRFWTYSLSFLNACNFIALWCMFSQEKVRQYYHETNYVFLLKMVVIPLKKKKEPVS